MSEIVGGLRARLIRESLFEKVQAGLTSLGWFATNRPHSPVTFESRGKNQNEQIIINTAALSDETDRETGWEMGSNMSETTWQMYIDFFAESDAIGLHFIKDVRDILRGKLPSIGHGSTFFNVYDYRQATPPILFQCEIDNVDTDKAHGFLKPWLEHWYACSFDIIDTYGDDS